MMKKILVIEDEPNIKELILYNLNSNGFAGIGAKDGFEGLTLIDRESPDLILLDIMLPGIDGLDLCRQLRAKGNKTPVIMLTAKSDEIARVTGLDLGADDYITKPFGIRELIARIKAVLRRYEDGDKKNTEETASDKIILGDLIIDEEGHRVSKKGQKIGLALKEFELLLFLAKNRGKIYTREELLNKVWGTDFLGESRTVDVHIRNLRKKLDESDFNKSLNEEEKSYIETIRGKGYRMR